MVQSDAFSALAENQQAAMEEVTKKTMFLETLLEVASVSSFSLASALASLLWASTSLLSVSSWRETPARLRGFSESSSFSAVRLSVVQRVVRP